MKYSIAALVAFAAAVLGKPVLTNSQYEITEGEPFTITWSDAQGPVTLTLVSGPESNLVPVFTITSGETGNSYTWTPSDIPSGTYAIRIEDSTPEANFGPRFQYQGTGELATSSATATSVTSATSSETETETSEPTSSETETETETDTATETATETETETTATPSTTLSTETETPTTESEAPTETPPNNNDSKRLVSPLALVLGTVAALAFFN